MDKLLGGYRRRERANETDSNRDNEVSSSRGTVFKKTLNAGNTHEDG
jgi:hypothetical protein